MVFESLVADVLNRVLGDYVENLDSKQLKIGIWGGDVVLKDLVLKQTALNDLDLPVQVVYGRLAKLVLKIPWKNLYYAAVEASIEGLYLLVQPNKEIVYNAEKEEKKSFDLKQSALTKIEETRKRQLEVDKKKKGSDTLVEKLTTQIIRNVQVSVKHIHIRYEDKITNPEFPFSMGVTLNELLLHTTDSAWNEAIIYDDQACTKIHKVVNLDGLAIYWNSNSILYGALSFEDLIERLHKEIPTKTFEPAGYDYILGPINSSARLKLNPKPELDEPAFSIPKAIANLEMEKLSIGLTKLQYKDVVAFADSLDLMSMGIPYRKYRPNVPSYRGYYRDWWHFAYKSILESEVRRKRNNWNWDYLKTHLENCKTYYKVYLTKMRNKKCPPEVLDTVTEMEKKLDVLNILLVRQKVQLELERLGKIEEKKPKQSWFSSWWSSPPADDESAEKTSNIVSKFQAAMTAEEKKRLYQAIDYEENEMPTIFPKSYVDNSCTFILKLLEIKITDENVDILTAQLLSVKCKVETRTAGNGFGVYVNLNQFLVSGVTQDDFIPRLVSSNTMEDVSLLDVTFETNPYDTKFAQRIHLKALPLQVIYDAVTINKVIDVFKVPSSSALAQLSEATANRISDVKTKSTAGFQYMIDKHSLMDINVDLCAPYLILPYGGKYTEIENIIVANLGRVKITTVERHKTSLKEKHKMADSPDKMFQVMVDESYDNFIIELTAVQILLVSGGDRKWMDSMVDCKPTPLHLLNPLSLHFNFYKCLIDDVRLPKSKMSGVLPSLTLTVTDLQLVMLLTLLNSIPFPKEDEDMIVTTTKSRSEITFADRGASSGTIQTVTKVNVVEKRHVEDLVQHTLMELNFVLKELTVTLSHQEYADSIPQNVAVFIVHALECEVQSKTFMNQVVVRLGGIYLHKNYNGENIEVISTPICAKDTYLFTVNFLQVDKNSPEFKSKYNCCELLLQLDFAVLKVVLHQEVLQELVKYVTDLQFQLDELQQSSLAQKESRTSLKRRLSTISDSIATQSVQSIKLKQKAAHKPGVIETIILKLEAKMDELAIEFANSTKHLSRFSISNLNTEVIVKKPYTQVKASLKNLLVVDSNPDSFYPKIMSVLDDEAANIQLVIYNKDQGGKTLALEDVKVVASFGRIKVVFLNLYVTTMLNFVNKFQAAREAIIEASAAAADTAKHNVTDIYANAVRVSLTIHLHAPEIIIPKSSIDTDALFIDLGTLHATNDFLVLDLKNDSGQPGIIDEMQVRLTELQLSRIRMDRNYKTIKDITLLKPLSFSLNLKRNLSNSWYHAIPDIHIVAQMQNIEFHIGQPDYQMIMATLNGNLGEGATVEEKIEIKQSDVENRLKALKVPSGVEMATIHEVSEDKPIGAADEDVHIFLKFNFMMNSFNIGLYTNDEDAEDKFSFDTRRIGLALFSLEGLSIKGRILTDGTINTSVLLVDCILDDIRPGKQTLNRLFSRKLFEETVCPSRTISPFAFKTMIDVTYKQRHNDIYLDVRVSGFDLILSIDFLQKVQTFFMSALGDEPAEAAPAKHKVKTTPSGHTIRSQTSRPIEAEASQRNISFNIQLEKPDIVLVETMTTIDTNCAILNCELLLKLRIDGKNQVINGTIQDIQLYTCVYNPEKRIQTKGNVIHPFTVSVAGATPEGQGLHIEVCLSNVHIRVSPNIIELLNRGYITMSGVNKEISVEAETSLDHTHLWDMKPYRETEHWFFRTELAEEAYDSLANIQDDGSGDKVEELCILRLPSLKLTVEAGVGNKTLPMLLLESNFIGKVKNWSSDMVIESTLAMQMGYYNSSLALWEPLIEPVEETVDNVVTYHPWELKLDVTMNNSINDTPTVSSPTTAEGEFQEIITQQPKMSIEFTSNYNLEATITKSALDVLSALGNAFAEAVSTDVQKTEMEGAPYKLKNECGINVKVLLQTSSFNVFGNSTPKEIVLESGTSVPLELKETDKNELQLNEMKKSTEKYLHLKMVDINSEIMLNVVRADRRYFSLKYRGEFNNQWGMITSTVIESGVVVVTLSSIVKVHNHFSIPIDIYYMTPKGNELKCIGSIKPGSSFNVPLNAIYTPTNELFFSVTGYSVTNNPFIWKDLQTNVNQTQILQSFPSDESLGHNEPFVIKAVGKMEQIYNENTLKHTMTSILCNVHLQPAIRFRNFLPIDISLSVQNINTETPILPGSTLTVPNIIPGYSYVIVRLLNYLEKEWSCVKDVLTNPPEFSVWTFDSFQGTKKMSIDLGVHVLNEDGAFILSLYCPFWMLNKSELNLSYRTSDENLNILHHPANYKDLILFSFNPKNFFGKKKASVRISNGGEWSDKFSIDVAGSSGVVTCKHDGKIYQLGVHIQLTYNGLTKQVTFTPYYVMLNSTNYALECQEYDRPGDPWTQVQSNSCAALWPIGDHDDKLLKLRVVGTEEVSPAFFITESHTTLLKLKNKYGGINVDIQITEGAVYINFSKYDYGLAPALIINSTKNALNMWERETVNLRQLEPNHKVLYTWDNPAGVRVLVWEGGYRKEIEDDLRKDGGGEYAISENQYVYWVSFLDGMQRVLLFTENKTVAENAQLAKHFEQIDQEVTLSIHGLGLSLVNNEERKEITYLRIASSGVIWETCKQQAKKFKPMGHKDSSNMEIAYQQYLLRKNSSEENIGRTVVDSKTEVDFDTLEMLRPHHRKIRRTFSTGLWFQMSTNQAMMQLHAKINKLQIDNQMFDCLFPVVLAPVIPPKTVATTDIHKPFAELSVVQLLMHNSQIKQYKYFKILIQEFHIKLDLAFVNAVMNVFPQTTTVDLEGEKQKFLLDTELVNKPLYQHVSMQSQQEQKSFYDLLHFSPLKIHVSFSLGGGDSGQNVATPNFINVLLQGIGVTLTDMQDVVFKLAYFEREYSFLTQKQLVGEASSHYIGQAVKQLYVLVLGLDVLGNPYGLVLGITKGVEDLFYEPIQGAIQGPGEFAEGLALGVRSLFGHTVGGAAGAVSRITGAMGKGLAALTFDKEYQRKRRDQMSKRPANVQEGFARSGKGLVMGVYDGITGVVRKPITGAKEEGVGGFIKGLGKGAVGLVTRPTAGVIDFASSSLDTVKRVTELGGEDTQRIRNARFVQADGQVTPYNTNDAIGYKLLQESDKGKYANTDVYAYHFTVIFKKEVLLMTDKRLAYITHNDLFGGWQVNWCYTWPEILVPPKVVPKGVAITLVEGKKRKTGLFSSADGGKTILIADPKICEEICNRIAELQKTTTT